jgi:hypothetical protein
MVYVRIRCSLIIADYSVVSDKLIILLVDVNTVCIRWPHRIRMNSIPPLPSESFRPFVNYVELVTLLVISAILPVLLSLLRFPEITFAFGFPCYIL